MSTISRSNGGPSSSQGESWCTPRKQADLGMVIKTHLSICAGILTRSQAATPHYLYLDLTAGCGVCLDHPGVDGSPLIFAKAAARAPKVPPGRSFPVRSFLFEKEREPALALSERICPFQSPEQAYHVVVGNHADLLTGILEAYPVAGPPVYGLLYVDPNGELPWDLLAQVARQPCFRTLDFLCHVGATTIKRCRTSPLHSHQATLLDHLRAIGKRHLIIRESVGRQQWTFALLTNWQAFPKFERHGFYQADSERGRAILEKLTLTETERRTARESGDAVLPVAWPARAAASSSSAQFSFGDLL